MAVTVCLFAHRTLYYPRGGGHLWVFLNWALGLRSLGCRVVWLEMAEPGDPVERVRTLAESLRARLAPYGLADDVALCSAVEGSLPRAAYDGFLDLDAAAGADLLLNFKYDAPPRIVGRFRRSALIDIDPGLLQTWVSGGQIRLAPHDIHFTIGETVGSADARFPDAGLEWHYTPPCVALDGWPVRPAPADDASFTTVSHWYGSEHMLHEDGEWYLNDKRSSFLPYMDLPRLTSQPLELALCLSDYARPDKVALEAWGWRVRHAHDVAASPGDYRRYIQGSRGEFSCAKPSCARLKNAWISDRTLCYLASGRPAVVQHTGPSRILPEAAGLFRFRNPREAAVHLETAAADYDRQSRLARALAEEWFDAREVVGRVLSRALP